jgi:dihydroorotate dehydrogenase (NAD+) catalytic subunit
MAQVAMQTSLGPITMRSPLVAASGTVGSVWEWATVADVVPFGAAVSKSVSEIPWPGKPAPRVAPAGPGMLNGIGIQNPGIDDWVGTMTGRIEVCDVPVWGSAVGETVAGFVKVAAGEETAGVAAIEVNLSCPNLEEGKIFALDAGLSARVVREVVSAVNVPVGAKLSPAASDIVSIAAACIDAGADFLTLTNTIPGFGVDIALASPKLSGGVGGYSGPGLKAISLRCVYEVARAFPGFPIVGCGGVTTGDDVVEYLMSGASAVGLGTVLLAEPRAGTRIEKETKRIMKNLGIATVTDAIGVAIK